ncbi:membrane progestin receptor beta [Sphaeramia orbicularis]|uniref:Membrane progestin receptor beta-like n=1 Tax=Sphaeramia orbicularis TaxID=375764 RepID=A0A673AVV4_9TELE|nr:membrane progestin receptor beta-like [Sphaeramia orbicularis]
MSSVVLQRLSLSLSLKHLGVGLGLGPLPHLLERVTCRWLPWPRPTVGASQVPSLFREPYILSGYRPVGQAWRCYVLSLFHKHNESVNVWTHLLAVPVLLFRWWAHVGSLGYTLDLASLPLGLFLLSALTYLFLSVSAHLLQSRSEQAHYFFFFMDYVGVAVYQYGCSLGHYFYTSEPAWRDSYVGRCFLQGTALLGWLSCAGCCFAKSRYRRPYPPRRKLCQLIPTTAAYFLGISPVAHRLVTVSWEREPWLVFHALQIASFLLSALFFACPIPERFYPGRFDLVGHGHQIFHLFLSLCTVCQLEALFHDYARRKEAVLGVFGEGQLWWACLSFPGLSLGCVLTALMSMRQIQKKLKQETEH